MTNKELEKLVKVQADIIAVLSGMLRQMSTPQIVTQQPFYPWYYPVTCTSGDVEYQTTSDGTKK